MINSPFRVITPDDIDFDNPISLEEVREHLTFLKGQLHGLNEYMLKLSKDIAQKFIYHQDTTNLTSRWDATFTKVKGLEEEYDLVASSNGIALLVEPANPRPKKMKATNPLQKPAAQQLSLFDGMGVA